jgi:kynurenine formamidase
MEVRIVITEKEIEKEWVLSNPIDLSISVSSKEEALTAWYLGPPEIEPHREGDFVGAVRAGASTNFNTIRFNPHAHGTHTECLGHITEEFHSVNNLFPLPFLPAVLVSVRPEKRGEDHCLTAFQLQEAVKALNEPPFYPKTLLLRTLPNDAGKKSRQYSHSNPPYLTEEAAVWIREAGFEHLLIDLPSVDKEVDGGALKAHKAFWGLPDNPRKQATITEFLYVPEEVLDGYGFLDLQVGPFENDASPSRPVWFKIVN